MTADPNRTVAVITADLLARNDDAPAPGRITILGDCPVCGDHRRELGSITAGRWQVEHSHDGSYSAHLLRLDTA